MANVSAETITVLIVDDHVVVRQGLRTFLELQDDIEVLGEVGNGAEAVELARQLNPNVALMDLVMPGMDGIAATHELHGLLPDTKVIALASFEDEQVFSVIEAGAAGYLLKDVSPAGLVSAIRAAHRGEAQLHPDVAKTLMEGVAKRVRQQALDEPSFENLTTRKLEVLHLIGRGMSNREIAAQLTISQKTVKTHVSSILGKLGLADRTQAAIFAVRQGLGE